MTTAEQFKALAAELLPHHDSLQDLPDGLAFDQIEDYVFRSHGEYVGGMASALIAMLERGVT